MVRGLGRVGLALDGPMWFGAGAAQHLPRLLQHGRPGYATHMCRLQRGRRAERAKPKPRWARRQPRMLLSCLLVVGVAPRPPPTALRFLRRRRNMASSSPNCAFQLRLNPLTGDSEWLVIDEADGEGEAPHPTTAPSQHKQLLAATSYLDMLNDAARNRAYRRAIEATITDPAARVLDIG